MSDDILKALARHTIRYRRKVNGRHHFCQTRDVVDEIKKLRSEVEQRDAEIERLRDAGDKLAEGVEAALHPFPANEPIDLSWLIHNWNGARRER